VTTAVDDLDARQLREHPRSGALFTAHIEVAGQPTTCFNSAHLKENP
jgi:hypothetical protein